MRKQNELKGVRKTKKKNKGVRAYSLGGILLIVLIILLFACGALSVSLPKCADNDGAAVSSVRTVAKADGTDMTANYVTGYYADVLLNGLEAELVYSGNTFKLAMGAVGGFGPIYRTDHNVTVLIIYPDALYEGKPVFISGIFTVNFPASGFWGNNITFKSDCKDIRVQYSFYRFMTEKVKDYSKIKMTVLLGDYSFPVRCRGNKAFTDITARFNVTTNFHADIKPPDIDDPFSGNFELGGGDGINGTTPSEDILAKILLKIWEFILKYWKYILIVIVCLFLLGVVINLFNWISGGKKS